MSAQNIASGLVVAMAGAATSADDLWAAAIAQLNEDDQKQVQAQVQQKDKLSILNDTIFEAQQKADQCVEREWKYTRADGSKVVFRHLFNKIVSWIDRFKQIGDVAASFEPTYAAPAWGLVKVLLQVAIADSQIYTAMLEGLEIVANLIAQYAIFEEVYLKHPSQAKSLLEQSITKMYARILSYLVKTKHYFEESTTKRVAKAMVRQTGFVKDDLEKIRSEQITTEELARLIDAEDIRAVTRTTETTSLDVTNISNQLRKLLADVQQPLSAIKSDLTNISQNYDKKQRLKILQWISTMPYPQHHDLVAKHRLKDSGLWFVNHPLYVNWRQSSTSCVLWLHGIPGSGKSNLMSLVVDSLRENKLSKKAGSIAYAYCVRSPAESYRAEPEAIARSFVRQLAYSTSTAAIDNAVMQKYETLGEDEFEPRGLHLDECEELILGMLRQRSATIVIDALDECIPERRYQLLGLLERLISSAVSPVKVIISSRDHGDVAARMTKLSATAIDTREGLGDIDLYVQAEVDRSIRQKSLLGGDVSGKLRSVIVERLKQGAQGMFLWVSLMIKNLCNPERIKFESDALEELDRLPQALNELYAKICQRIKSAGSRARRLAEACLKWLICSQSPLKSTDFVALVSFDAVDSGEIVPTSRLLEVCDNLVIHDTDLDIFRLAHLSIREFLETQSEFASNIAHVAAARACLNALTNAEWLKPATTWSTSALYRYATLYSTTHLSLCEQRQRTTELAAQIKQFFASDGILTPYSEKWMIQVVDAVKTLSWNDPLKEMVEQVAGNVANEPKTWIFTACVFGFDELVEQVCRSIPVVAKKLNTRGTTTLHLASQYGHLRIVKILMSIGIDVNVKDSFRESALTLASAHGHVQIVQYLLENKAEQEHDGHKYGSPLSAASFHGHKDIVKMLTVDADLDASRGPFGTALQAASLRGHRDVVLMLINLGMDVNAPSQTVTTTSESVVEEQDSQSGRLEYLSSQLTRFGVPKNEQGTKILMEEIKIDQIQEGVMDVGIHRSGLGSAIQLACRGGYADVVALLLDHGADVEYEGGMYGHALQAAAVNGSQLIADLLINAGAYIDAQSGLYGCALQAACRRNHASLVKSLLNEGGASVNMCGGYYHTPLQAAARTGNSELINILLQHKADVNIFGGQYHTALQAAAAYGFIEVVQQLIDHNANVNICGGQYHSALEAAAHRGSVDIVKLLLESGANVYNALHIAALEGRLEVVRCLLSQKVNVNARKHVFGTPLLNAISTNRHDIIELLIEHQADLDAGNSFWGYPLQLAAAAGNTALVQRLLRRNSDPTQIGGLHGVYLTELGRGDRKNKKQNLGNWQESALESAATSGQADTVRVLLKDLLAVARTGHPWPSVQQEISEITWSIISMALLKAAWYNHSEVISILLDACENEPHLHRASAFWWSCKNGNERLARSLLDEHRDSIQDGDFPLYGSTNNEQMVLSILKDDPLTVAIHNGHKDLVQLLLGSNIEESVFGRNHGALEAACVVNDQPLVSFFVAGGIDVDRAGRKTNRPLMLASAWGNTAIVGMLLRAGANPNFWSSSPEASETNYLTPLHAACGEGHDEIVMMLLSHGATVDVQFESHSTALLLACQTGHTEIVRMLVQSGANVDATDRSSERLDTALQIATSKGFYEIAKLLLENKANPNTPGGKFGTALKTAAFFGHTDILLALLHAGADANFTDDFDGHSDFENLELRSRPLIHRALLQFDASAVSHYGQPSSAINQASEGSSDSNYESALEEPLIDSELDRGSDQSASGARKIKALTPKPVSGQRYNTSTTSRMRDSPVSVTMVLYKGQRGISVAASQNMKRATVEIFIQVATTDDFSREYVWRSDSYSQRLRSASSGSRRGSHDAISIPASFETDRSIEVKPGSSGTFGSAIHAAAHRGSVDCVRILIDHKAEISCQDRYGQTPLHHAAHEGHFDVVKHLLSHGSAVDIRDQKGRTALAIASASGRIAILKLLVSRGAAIDEGDARGRTALHIAAENNHLNIVKVLLGYGADAGAQDNHGETPLARAIGRDNTQVARHLMRIRADTERTIIHASSVYSIWRDSVQGFIEEMTETRSELSLFHTAAQWHSHGIVHMLLEQGYDVNAYSSATNDSRDGGTALHFAIANGRDSSVDTISVLLCHGADPNLKDGNGVSPISLAIEGGSYVVVDLLLRVGGTVEGCARDLPLIHLALQSALNSGSCKMMKLVLDHSADVNALDKKGQTALQVLVGMIRREGRRPEDLEGVKEQACVLLLQYEARIPPDDLEALLVDIRKAVRNRKYDEDFFEQTGFELNEPLYSLVDNKPVA